MDRVTLGGLAALGAALSWAIGAVLFKRRLLHERPSDVTLFKTVFALPLFALTWWLLSAGDAFPLDREQCFWLTASGICGLAAGDTALFTALRDIGAQRTMLIQATGPVIATLVAAVWPGEALGGWQLTGIGLTVTGVAWVIGLHRRRPAEPLVARGVVFAGMSATFNALGIVMTRRALQGSFELEARGELALAAAATSVRLAAAASLLVLVARWRARREDPLGGERRRPAWGRLVLPSFIGTYVGLALVMLALVHTPSGIVAALSSTTPLYLLPLGFWFLGEPLRVSAVAGTIVAVLGVALIFLSDSLG